MRRLQHFGILFLLTSLLVSCAHYPVVSTVEMTPTDVQAFNKEAVKVPHEARLVNGRRLRYPGGVRLGLDDAGKRWTLTGEVSEKTAPTERVALTEVGTLLRYEPAYRDAGRGAADGARTGFLVGAGVGLLFGVLAEAVGSQIGDGDAGSGSGKRGEFLLLSAGAGAAVGTGTGALLGVMIGAKVQPCVSVKLKGF